MRGVFINLGPPSVVSPEEAVSDLRAILGTEPDFAMGVEAVFKGPLPKPHPGYVKIRVRSPQPRANLFVYLKTASEPKHRWEDMQLGFPREPGRPGHHVPRSDLVWTWRRAQWRLAHHPPGWPGTEKARIEHLTRIREDFAPWTTDRWATHSAKTKAQMEKRPRLLFWDRNMDLRAFRSFAELCDAKIAGETVDSLMYRGLTDVQTHYTRVFDGHRVHTDHKRGALVVSFKIGT